MAIIQTTDLQTVVDKLARWAAMSVGDAAFNPAFTAGMAAANAAVMSGAGSLFTLLHGLADGDPAADMLQAARNLDESNPVPPTRFMIGIAGISAFMTALNTHIARYNPATPTLDAFLTALNATTPTLRVHQALHDHLRAFSRKNVFIANDTILATFAATAAATGTFASVTTIGTNYAGAKLVVKNNGAVTTGATLTVTDAKWTANLSTGIEGGGALLNRGTATLTRTNIDGNSARQAGGGIINVGANTQLTLIESTLQNNRAGSSSDGGGLYNGATATIDRSLFTNNTAVNGGAITNNGFGSAVLSLDNSTVSGNFSSLDAGGIFNVHSDDQVDILEALESAENYNDYLSLRSSYLIHTTINSSPILLIQCQRTKLSG